VEITKADIYEAMRSIAGYLDITPDDFERVYVAAFRHALRRLSEDVAVDDVMSVDVLAVSPASPLRDVAAAMAARHVSGVPVVDDERRPVGVVSEHDFLALMAGAGRGGGVMDVVASCALGSACLVSRVATKVAADVMTSPAVVALRGTPVAVATELLADHGVNRLPVVDGGGRVVGIVTRGDLLRRASRGGAP
jgi:CBS-domain-containing membrane protein